MPLRFQELVSRAVDARVCFCLRGSCFFSRRCRCFCPPLPGFLRSDFYVFVVVTGQIVQHVGGKNAQENSFCKLLQHLEKISNLALPS